MRWLIRFLIWLPITGCTQKQSTPLEPILDPNASIQALDIKDDSKLLGVSGAAQRQPHEIWLAPERTGHLVRVELKGQQILSPTAWPIIGLSPDATPSDHPTPDLESIAFLDKNRVLIGTEGRHQRAKDPIYIAQLLDQQVRIQSELTFNYKVFDIMASDNKGIEGLCVASEFAVASSEMIKEVHGQRLALVGVFRLLDEEFFPYLVKLNSSKGKLSSISCRQQEDKLIVFGIERHFGIMRLIQFEIPAPSLKLSAKLNLTKRATGSDSAPVASTQNHPQLSNPIKSVLIRDFAPEISDNLEGLIQLSSSEFFTVTDNFYGRKTGKIKAYLIKLSSDDL